MTYDSIGKAIVQRSKMSELPIRDKLNLFNDLMEELGLNKWAMDNPDESEPFQKAWKAMMDKHWPR